MPFIKVALTGLALAGAALLCAPVPAQAQRSRCRAHDVSLSPTDGHVAVNSTAPILATTYDAAGNPCDNATYTWSSSAPSVATVDRNGIVHGISVGTATITARTGVGAAAKLGRSTVTVEESDVTVQAATPDSTPGYHPVAHPPGPGTAAMDFQPDGAGLADNINVEPLQLVLIKGERRRLEIRALKADGTPAARVPVVFQLGTGGERIASVDTFGFVSGLMEAGTAMINLTVPGNSRIQPKIVRVEVRNDSVQFNRRELTMAPGATDTLSIYVPTQQRALDPRLFQFSSSDPTKLQVTPGAVLTAVSAGTVTIVGQNAYLPEIRATVHIHRRVRQVTVAPTDRPMPADSTVIIPIGGPLALRARALAADGTDVPEADLTWQPVDPSGTIQFDTAQKVVRGVRSGQAAIYVSTLVSRDTSASARVRIRVVAGGLSTPRTRIGLGVGEHTTVEVALLDEQRHSAGSANAYLTWASDSVARVENGNQLVALRPGHTRLVGRTGWDSTVTLDVYVVGDLLVLGRSQGRQGVLVLNSAGQVLGFAPDSLVEFLAWSPDLTRLAATSQVSVTARVPAAALRVVNADGTGAVRLTDDSANARYPSFVPGVTGGSQIVFEWNKRGIAQIWKIDLQGDTPGTPQQLTTTQTTANQAPAVSPDGRKIAYVSVRSTSPGRPTYGLYQANIDGTEEHLVHPMPQGHRIVGAPAFSLDGRSLLFVRAEPPRQGVATQRLVRIAVTAQPTDTLMTVTPVDIVVAAFSQSPDGQALAITWLTPLPGGASERHLLLFNLASGVRQPIDAPDMRPANPAFRPATPNTSH